MNDMIQYIHNAQQSAVFLLIDANKRLSGLMGNEFVSRYEKQNISELIKQNEQLIAQYGDGYKN